jgi:DNA-binding transcriptional ArsR family regulator/uncharacterized protein YndB with AHSA1/START domain
MANRDRALTALSALADPTRREIFEALNKSPSAVGTLAARLPVSRPAVSQHLKVLKEAGLVTEISAGTRRIYRIDPRGIGAIRDWLDRHWSNALTAFQAYADSEEDQMSIQPVRCSLNVKAPPTRAFEFFTGDITRWWPKDKTIGASPAAEVILEPRTGGRWFERAADGTETGWGKVLAWEPPERLVLGWQIDANWKHDPNFETEVELLFKPEGTGTLVTLEHRNLERFGDSAQKIATQISGGWPAILNVYADYAATHASDPSRGQKERV